MSAVRLGRSCFMDSLLWLTRLPPFNPVSETAPELANPRDTQRSGHLYLQQSASGHAINTVSSFRTPRLRLCGSGSPEIQALGAKRKCTVTV